MWSVVRFQEIWPVSPLHAPTRPQRGTLDCRDAICCDARHMRATAASLAGAATSPVYSRPMPKCPSGPPSVPPKWVKPQLKRLVDEAPTGDGWLHEVKYDGYRMHARLEGGRIQLLTRTGLDWSHRYRFTIEALRSLPVKSA